MINRDQYEEHRARMRARMKSPHGRDRYRWRGQPLTSDVKGQTVERRFGYIKHGLGLRRFLRRGLEAVRTEWSLLCTAANVGILLRHWPEVMKVL